jgi:glycogen operon protein
MSVRPALPASTWPGRPTPLGATWDGEGTNVALFSSGAEAVDVCLFEDYPDGRSSVEHRIPLQESTSHVWHGYLPQVGPGARYGFRVDGPFDPARGLRHNPSKLLLDPYARAVDGAFVLDDAVFGSLPGRDAVQDHRDSAPFVPRGRRGARRVPLGRRPAAAHPVELDRRLRAAREGLHRAAPRRAAAPARHLRRAGPRGVGRAPARARRHRRRAAARAPLRVRAAPAAAGAGQPLGLQLARLLRAARGVQLERLARRAGARVQGDGAHAARGRHRGAARRGLQPHREGDHLGPTLSLRGIDNVEYYRLEETDRAHYRDYTGTGNTLAIRSPHVLQLITDSLRYWVTRCTSTASASTSRRRWRGRSTTSTC